MDPNLTAFLSVLFGALIGGGTTFIAVRKMPADIALANSQRDKNLIESNRMLSDQLHDQQKEIAEMRAWFVGGIEIVTTLHLTNPPQAEIESVKRIPLSTDSG